MYVLLEIYFLAIYFKLVVLVAKKGPFNTPVFVPDTAFFKQVYGDTVFAYLLEHKMQEARRMLDSQKYNVNEVGLKLGYSTSSHFINAFKKKYGITPKKYVQSQTSLRS